ncbi:KxYKxGKxW signal peptide domain-containing protein, partial [Liquorilactobacillus sucicola]
MHKQNEEKLHYKMYKAGKYWLFSTIAVSSFAAGIQLRPSSEILASQTQKTSTKQVNTKNDSSSQKTVVLTSSSSSAANAETTSDSTSSSSEAKNISTAQKNSSSSEK